MSGIYSRTIVRLMGVMLLMLGTVGLAAAHAHLVRSEPAADSTVSTAPQQVVLYFSEALADGGNNSITVVDAAGATVSTGDAQMMANDNTAMMVGLQANLAPGQYTVRWTNEAVDGHGEEGSFSFNVAAADAATTQAPAPGVAQLPQTGVPVERLLSAMLVLLGLVLLGAGFGLSRAGRRTDEAKSHA